MIYARLSYNSLDWVRPSGPHGKSGNNHVHENDFRFGFEEWIRSPSLYFSDKNGQSFHYGYLEGIHKNFKPNDIQHDLNLFTLYFNGINPTLRYLVGTINSGNWDMVPPNESNWIIQNNQRVVNQMLNELNQATNNFPDAINKFHQHMNNQNNYQLFNIKYINMNYVFNQNAPLPQNHPVIVGNMNRFWLY